jgi:peptide/nickel transport system permease protein
VLDGVNLFEFRPGAMTEGGAQVVVARRATLTALPPWAQFLVRRLAGGVIALFVASLLVFASLQVLPGSPASVVLGRNATPEAVAELQHRMGLDRPWYERYGEWAGGFVTGDLGDSAVGLAQGATEAPISELISGPAKNSAVLALLTIVLMIPISMAFGVWAAIRSGRPLDHGISLLSLVAISLPEFVVASLLIAVFFVHLDWLPPVTLVPPGASPLDHPDALVLPILTLLGAGCANGIRMVRAGMVEALGAQHVQMARLNGLPENRVVTRYAMRNALGPSVQVLAQNCQWLVGGIIVTEAVFAYPGLGQQLVNAVENRDVTLIQSVAMLIAVVYVLINIVADFVVLLLVPRLRT